MFKAMRVSASPPVGAEPDGWDGDAAAEPDGSNDAVVSAGDAGGDPEGWPDAAADGEAGVYVQPGLTALVHPAARAATDTIAAVRTVRLRVVCIVGQEPRWGTGIAGERGVSVPKSYRSAPRPACGDQMSKWQLSGAW
jgi:hypothetical protein